MQGLGETTAMLARLRRSLPGASKTDQAAAGMIETTSFGENPGGLRMLSYAPPGLDHNAPLIVVLHGCTQTGEGYAQDAGWLALADRLGFAVLAPEQRPINNPNRCFNWFEPGDIGFGLGEAASISAMVHAALAIHHGDPERVFVTGLSAGGTMSAVMLAAYPDLFAGAAIIAGLPYGVAHGVPAALRAMSQGGGRPAPTPSARADSRQAPLKVSIWHGDADAVVNAANGADLAAQWAAATGLAATPRQVEPLGARTRTVCRGASDGAVVELNVVRGMGHGVPLSTQGQDGLGRVAPYMLEVGISSTLEIARFWDLGAAAVHGAAVSARWDDQAAREERAQDPSGEAGAWKGAGQPEGLAARVLDAVSAHVSPDIHDVIAKALRAAGLVT